MATELQADNFDDALAKASKPILVDFFATWCGPCVQQAPILEKWAAANADKVEVAKLDIDKAPALASKYSVMSIPTLVLFKGGKEAGRAIGLQNEKSLTALLAKAGG